MFIEREITIDYILCTFPPPPLTSALHPGTRLWSLVQLHRSTTRRRLSAKASLAAWTHDLPWAALPCHGDGLYGFIHGFYMLNQAYPTVIHSYMDEHSIVDICLSKLYPSYIQLLVISIQFINSY